MRSRPGGQHPLERSLAARPLGSRDSNSRKPTSLCAGSCVGSHHARKTTPATTTTTSSSSLSQQASSTLSSVVETFKVMARVRPRLAREMPNENVRVRDDFITVTGDVAYASSTRTTRHKFDRVFDRSAEQADVYQSVAPLIEAAFDGFNATIFAYGQTGTGKTHTMLGVDIWNLGQQHETSVQEAIRSVARTKELWGIIPRAMEHIFAHVEDQRDRFQFKIWCSYLEIYKENVYDLLHDEARPGDQGQPLEIRAVAGGSSTAGGGAGGNGSGSAVGGVFVPDATDVRVQTEEQVLAMLWKGARNRAISATDMNAHSSRSHTVFQIVVERKERGRKGASSFLRCGWTQFIASLGVIVAFGPCLRSAGCGTPCMCQIEDQPCGPCRFRKMEAASTHFLFNETNSRNDVDQQGGFWVLMSSFGSFMLHFDLFCPRAYFDTLRVARVFPTWAIAFEGCSQAIVIFRTETPSLRVS